MAPLSAITELLGSDAKSLLEHRCTGITKESLHLPGPDWVDRMHLVSDRPTPILRSLQSLNDHGRLAGHRLPVHSPRGPGHRALGRRIVRQEPDLLRSREHREAGDGGRVQCGGEHARRARLGRAQVCPPHSLHGQVQSQRVPHLSQQVRPDRVREHEAGAGHGMRGGGCHDLLRVGRVGTADRGGEPGIRHRARDGHGHGALVLPPQQRLQEGQGFSRLRRPDRPGQSPRRHHPGRHHQAEAAGEQRRVQRAQQQGESVRQDATSASTPNSPPTIQSTSPATRSPTATWDARG